MGAADDRKKRYRRLAERDGRDCFYCGKPLWGDETIEHLLVVQGVTVHHDSNCVLAHSQCNALAGNMGLAYKVKLRDEIRRVGLEVFLESPPVWFKRRSRAFKTRRGSIVSRRPRTLTARLGYWLKRAGIAS